MADDTRHSEERIIQGFFAPLAEGAGGAFGLRDDCAIITPPPGHDLVVTCDPVREGVHFFPDDDPADIAWKALAVNVSDLVAKGAEPLAYVMALSFPKFPHSDWLHGFASGLREAQDAFGIHLIGGDTDKAPGPFSAAITMFAALPGGSMVQRGTARAGDHIYVSGSLGRAALGLRLRRDPALAERWGLDGGQAGELLASYLRPRPPAGLIGALRAHAGAAMDLSDGLAKDLERMCAVSGVGAQVQLVDIPTAGPVAKVLMAEPKLQNLIVSGGDDYEILTAVAPENERAFIEAAKIARVRITRIGQFTADPQLEIFDPLGKPVALEPTGWDHF